MYVVILVSTGLVGAIGILYSCVAISTTYDGQVDDSVQEDFLCHYHKHAQKKK